MAIDFERLETDLPYLAETLDRPEEHLDGWQKMNAREALIHTMAIMRTASRAIRSHQKINTNQNNE